MRISGHASELGWGAAPSSSPGIKDPEGRLELPSLGSGPSPADAAESQAQSPVTPGQSGASGLGARKLCPETAQVKLGSDRGLPSVVPVPCAISPILGHSSRTQTFPDSSRPFGVLPSSPG